MQENFALAIIDSNVLSCLGLQQILEDLIPMAEIRLFGSFEQLQQAQATQHYIHYFISSRIYFEHTNFFRDVARQTIVMVHGDMQIAGMLTLNVCQSEQKLVSAILALHQRGHRAGHPGMNSGRSECPHTMPEGASVPPSTPLLSARETEVAILLSKGLINREIADALNISLTTVITHRKNIMEKLNARSLANIIVYTVMNGWVEVGEL